MEILVSRPYKVPNYTCFYRLKNDILSQLNIRASIGLFGWSFPRVPLPNVNVQVVNANDYNHTIQAKMRWDVGLVKSPFGPTFHIYCQRVGNKSCTVQVQCDNPSLQILNNNLFTFLNDIAFNIPIYGDLERAVRKPFKIYFEDELVLDNSSQFAKKRISEDLFETMLRSVFLKIHSALARNTGQEG